jgi:hypothetical protein
MRPSPSRRLVGTVEVGLRAELLVLLREPLRPALARLPGPATAVLGGYAPCAPIQKRHTNPTHIENAKDA